MNCHKGKQQLLDSAKSCSASDIGARNSGCLVSLREKDRCGKHRVIAVLAAVLCLVSGLTACSEQTEELTPEAYNARLDTLSGKNISVPAIVCEKYSNMIVFGIKSVIYDETEVQVINYLYIPPELFETQVGVGDHVLLTGELGVDDSGAQTLLHPEVSKEAASEQEEIDCAAFTGTYTDSANLVVTLKEDAQ